MYTGPQLTEGFQEQTSHSMPLSPAPCPGAGSHPLMTFTHPARKVAWVLLLYVAQWDQRGFSWSQPCLGVFPLRHLPKGTQGPAIYPYMGWCWNVSLKTKPNLPLVGNGHVSCYAKCPFSNMDWKKTLKSITSSHQSTTTKTTLHHILFSTRSIVEELLAQIIEYGTVGKNFLKKQTLGQRSFFVPCKVLVGSFRLEKNIKSNHQPTTTKITSMSTTTEREVFWVTCSPFPPSPCAADEEIPLQRRRSSAAKRYWMGMSAGAINSFTCLNRAGEGAAWVNASRWKLWPEVPMRLQALHPVPGFKHSLYSTMGLWWVRSEREKLCLDF